MTPRIVIVGAGFGGIGLGIQLRRAGTDSFTILEKADGIGGVWRDNTYPGLTCDVPSHLYSFSFEPSYDWTRRFPPQAEILAYLERCVDKHGLRDHLRLGAEVESAEFDSAGGVWRIRLAGGETMEADVLVAATGQLSLPSYPSIPGLDEFGGPMFHSARWDHSHELAGKRVGVIGTGASAVQFIPEIASEVERLEVFQRSAPWVIPKPDRPYPEWERRLYRRLPLLQAISRSCDYCLYELLVMGFTRHRWLLRTLERRALRRLRDAIDDDDLVARLTPDYPLGCKRVVIVDGWAEAMARSNVALVTTPIERVSPRGVVTADRVEHELDVLVLGTGFRANEFLAPMRVTGRDGVDLNETWREGAEAYLGITVSGFPNLYILYGPNTNLGANSIVYMLESQIRYVLGGIRAASLDGGAPLEVRPEVQREFNEELRKRLAGSVWREGCRSWYVNDAGRVTNNWPGMTLEYRRRTRRFDPADYRVVTAG
ncbi:MAG TPA: NAD(P)/FAD-dependent oxidoreductase [Solirubrobacterales bacterium]|nr:NAD(P)/FAD-dependent oxidoreductase [Solirubrobacterales bacterium]